MRMVLSDFDINATEIELENDMGTDNVNGTSYSNLIDCGLKRGLYCKYGENGSVEVIDYLTNLGWTVIVCYTLSNIPHYAIYGSNNGQHIFLRDPAFTTKNVLSINKFEKNWNVRGKKYENFKTNKWYAAFRK
jgi:ABC-type bacteriocin/lantibiotic exporter with double-glycine peptidase domain